MSGPNNSILATPVGVVRHYWRIAGAKPWHVVVPLLLILAANGLEGASLALLLPLSEAVAEDSFNFLDGSAAFGWLLALVPNSLDGSPRRDATLVGLIVVLMFVGRLGKFAFQYLSRRVVVSRSERYRVRISAETFGRVLGFGRQYFDRQALGRIDAEIGWSSSVLGLLKAAEGLFRHLMAIVIKIGVMLAISPPLVIAFVVSLPFVQWVVASINRRVRRIAEEGVEVDRRMRSELLDILGSVPLVKAYSQEESTAASYTRVLREAESIAVRRDRAISVRYPLEEITILAVMFLAQAAVVYATGDFRPAQLASFGAFLVVLQQSLRDYKMVSRFTLTVFEELPRLEAVAGLFSDEGKFIVPSGHREFEGLEKRMLVRDLRWGHQEGLDTLRGLDAEIPAGRVTAIVGPSGAGKTTFVDLLARLYDCPPGSIELDGVDIRAFSLPSLHARMAIVSQDVWLLNRSLRDNLVFGLESPPSDEQLLAALADVELAELVASLPVGLDSEVGDRGVRLSGGQRQRVALARALLRRPNILILDEATSALDSRVENQITRMIRHRASDQTVIIIAHRLSTIRHADQILVMDGGRVVEQGTWEELEMADGVFVGLLHAQTEDQPRVSG